MKKRKVKAKWETRHSDLADVSKSFFAVIPNGYNVEMMKVLLLGNDKKMAITLWESWNDGKKFDYEPDMKVIKIEAKNVC